MIKTLFLVAVLLVPGLAYAGNPSADLSIQITPSPAPPPPPPPPSGVACDQGPATSIPAPAQAAGFTHCALNADFTTSTTDANGINWQNTATYISQCGAPGTLAYQFSVYYYPLIPAPCNKAQIVNDPLGGGFKVLDANYLLSDQQIYINHQATCPNACGNNGDYSYSYTQLFWPSYQGGPVGLPQEWYIETVIYIPEPSLDAVDPNYNGGQASSQMSVNGIGNSGVINGGANQGYIAGNQFEIGTNNFKSTSWTAHQGMSIELPKGTHQPTPNGGSTYSTVQNFASGYHTIGVLFTSDETQRIASCSYFDGTAVMCIPGNNQSWDFSAHGVQQCTGGGWACYFPSNPTVLWETIGLETCFPNNFTHGNPVPGCYRNDTHVYYKSIRVFECTNYKAGHCPGSLITADNSKALRFAKKDAPANDHFGPEELVRWVIAWLQEAA